MRRLTGSALTAGTLLLVVWFGGCQDPVTIEGLDYPAGRIQGRVLSGGVPIDATIRAIQIVDGERDNDRFETEVHPGGLYTLDLPEGRFLLKLIMSRSWMYYHYSSSSPVYGQSDPDTFEVAGIGSIQQADFHLGGLDFQMDAGTHLEGQSGGVVLHRRGDDDLEFNPTYVDEGAVVIEGGHLDLKVGGIYPGEYRVEIVLGGHNYRLNLDKSERFWYPGTRDTLESPWIRVGLDSLTTLECEIDNELAYLEGRVSGAWLEMGLDYGPLVALFSPDSTLLISDQRTGYDGEFNMVTHLPAHGKIRVVQDRVEQWIGGPSFEDATVFSLMPGDTVTGVELVQCGLHVVQPEIGDTEMSSVSLKIFDESGEQLVHEYRFSSHDGPHVAVPNLWPGRFRVHVGPTNWRRGTSWWVDQWYDRKPDALAADPILLDQPGDITRLDLVPERGGEIVGEILLDVYPYIYYIVVADAEATTVWAQLDIWDRQATYRVRGLPDGAYKLGYRDGTLKAKADYELPEDTIWYPGTTDWDSAAVVVIQDAGIVEGIDFDLRP